MATEEDEVRALLMRHRKQIICDINESKLITVLTQKGVLSAANEKLLNDIQLEYRKVYPLNNATTPIIENLTATTNGDSSEKNCDDINEKKCTFLIDVIAQNGFEKFKEFCYAIENECPHLIEDLINDRLNSGKMNFCFLTKPFKVLFYNF